MVPEVVLFSFGQTETLKKAWVRGKKGSKPLYADNTLKRCCCNFKILIHILFESQDLKNQKYVKLSIVHCPPVTMAIIRRPDPKFQLGFSVEDGIVGQPSYFLCNLTWVRFGLKVVSPSQLVIFFTSLTNYTWLKAHLLALCGAFQLHLKHLFVLKSKSSLPVADLQSDAWRYSRERRHSCRAPHHWNKWAECRCHTTRQDHPDPDQCSRRGGKRWNAYVHN